MTTPDFDLDRVRPLLVDAAGRVDIDVVAECESSNSLLLQRAEAGAPSGSLVVAERQTAGRGRQGRRWITAPGDSLTFSLLWRFPRGTPPAGLSLAVGVAVAEALEEQDISPVQLKWPNDVLLDRGKVSGILIELVPGQIHAAVIGIGVNLRLPEGLPPELHGLTACVGNTVRSEVLLASLINRLVAVLDEFSTGGFAALRGRWTNRCAHLMKTVRLLSDGTSREARCLGADADGALLLETPTGMERLLTGDVSLRWN